MAGRDKARLVREKLKEERVPVRVEVQEVWISKEYCEMAERRIKPYLNQRRLVDYVA